jgi:hypothetical protein
MLAALGAIACCAPPAHAATGSFEVPLGPDGTIPELAGPHPAGDAVAFGVGSADGGWSVRVGAPGAGTREVEALAPARGLSIVLSASATRIAVSEHAEYCTDCKYMSYEVTRDALTAAPLGGPPVTLVRCERGSCADNGCVQGRPRFTAALSGDVLALRDACSATVSVVDLATGASHALGKADAMAVGGRFVALAVASTVAGQPQTIAVRSADTGAEVYRAGAAAAPGAAPVFGGTGTQLAVRADGVVVYESPAADGLVALVAASPALPAGRVVRTVPKATAILGLGASGALLATRPPAGLQLVALDGSAGEPFDIPDLVGGPAFDGDTIAWARRTCTTTAVTSWRLGDAPPPPVDLRCPTPLSASASLTLPRNRRLPLAFDCPATARGGCRAVARLTAQRRGRARRGEHGAARFYRLGRLELSLDPGARARPKLIVPAGAARWVRRHAPLRLRIEVTSDSERPAQRPAGDSGRTARIVTLRAAR